MYFLPIQPLSASFTHVTSKCDVPNVSVRELRFLQAELLCVTMPSILQLNSPIPSH